MHPGSPSADLALKKQTRCGLKRDCPRYIFTRAHMSRSMNLNSKKNAPGKTRTCYLSIRNRLLYPDELRGRFYDHRLTTAICPIIKMAYPRKPPKNKGLAYFLPPCDPYSLGIRKPMPTLLTPTNKGFTGILVENDHRLTTVGSLA